MTDNDPIKLFCTEWLLQNDCSRGKNCIFIHANMRDVTLCDDLTEEEVFVKGSYNHGWQKKNKNKHRKPRNKNLHQRQNMNRDNNVSNRYFTRNNHRIQKQSEGNVPSTSSHQHVTSSAPSSSTGASKKILNNNKNKIHHMFTSNTSESEDENSKNLSNLQHSKHEDWFSPSQFVPKNNKATDIKEKIECTEAAEVATKCVPIKQSIATAVAESQEKVCGICFEVIMEKSTFQRRFGILPNCNHCFCLTCLRKWRQAKFENNIIRACPECRVTSDFICPSTYWVETESAKEQLINNYKQALSRKDCKYFKKGNGSCPFGNKCFYLHALNNGTKIDVGPPPSQRFENELSDEMDFIQKLFLLEYYQNPGLLDELDFSDSDDDDDDDLFDAIFWSSDEDLLFF